MGRRLILTGWNHTAYAYAAAYAIQHWEKKAPGTDIDVRGITRKELPIYLSNQLDYENIIILGIGLDANFQMLKKALMSLKRQGTTIDWFTSVQYPCPADIKLEITRYDLMHLNEKGSDIQESVAISYNINYKELEDYWNCNTSFGRTFTDLILAAFYFHNKGDQNKDDLYPGIIFHLARNQKESDITQKENTALQLYRKYGKKELLGQSKAIQNIRKQITRFAKHTGVNLVIYGETGTGKEAIVQEIFNQSEHQGELISFNCANVNPNLLEERFMGHVKGAYTDAKETEIGLFERADKGILFLDEIGELPLEAQGLLLRVLDGGYVQKVGGKEETIVDVRVIAATNRDLPEMVRQHKFRQDLFMRLCTISITMPPLRAHMEDLEEIANNYRHKHEMSGDISKEQLEELMDYDYPGNVRELFSILAHANVLKEGDEEESYKEIIRQHKGFHFSTPAKNAEELPDNQKMAMQIHARQVLEKYNGNISQASKAMGINRNTLTKYQKESLSKSLDKKKYPQEDFTSPCPKNSQKRLVAKSPEKKKKTK